MDIIFTIVTVMGPVLGAVGYWLAMPVVFWLGALLALVTLFLNLASGAMNFPTLPGVAVIGGAIAIGPWWYGAVIGLLVWTAMEAAGEVYVRLRGA